MEREALKAEICSFINDQWADGEVELSDASREIGEFIISLVDAEDDAEADEAEEEDEEEDEGEGDTSDSQK